MNAVHMNDAGYCRSCLRAGIKPYKRAKESAVRHSIENKITRSDALSLIRSVGGLADRSIGHCLACSVLSLASDNPKREGEEQKGIS